MVIRLACGLPSGGRRYGEGGLGKVTGTGKMGLIPPTQHISKTRERHVIDGVEIVFQLTPGSEAPAEMHLFFPQLRALNLAENACQLMHNLCPIRGAKTRDALAWSQYLDEALSEYVPHVDVVYAQHHWPVWGAAKAGLGRRGRVWSGGVARTLKRVRDGVNEGRAGREGSWRRGGIEDYQEGDIIECYSVGKIAAKLE